MRAQYVIENMQMPFRNDGNISISQKYPLENPNYLGDCAGKRKKKRKKIKIKESLNESLIGTVLTVTAIIYLLHFIKNILETPEHKIARYDKKSIRDIYWIIKSRLDEPEKAPVYSDEYWFHKITFPEANKYFHKYTIKINKETKYMNVEIPNYNTRPVKLNDEQYDKFLQVIDKIKTTK